MTYHVLYNPRSNNKQGETTAKKLTDILTGSEVIYHDIIELTDYVTFFGGLPEDDVAIICGGDGTLNRFVNDTQGLTIRQKLLFYTAGSGNDFCRDLSDIDENGLVDLEKYIKDLPTVTVKGKDYLFLNGVGYGIDGYCCEVGDKLRETSDKPINYAGIAIKGLLFHFKPANATITIDGKTETFKKCWLAPTMNGRFYGGGMMPTPDQDRLSPEHKVSTLVYFGSGKLKSLIVFPSLFKGEHLKHSEMCQVRTGKNVKVVFDRPCALQIDGETILDVTEYEVHTAE